MRRANHIFFSTGEPPGSPLPDGDPLNDLLSDVDPPEDDIDALFKKLLRVNPPPLLVDSLLQSIQQQMPLKPWAIDADLWNDEQALDGLVVRKENLPPS